MLWWAMREIPLRDIANILKSLQPANLLILAALNAFILALFSVRWWLLLQTLGYRVPFLTLIKYRLASFGITYFTPGPQFGGEPLQVYLLHRQSSVPGTTALASVVLDKLLEVLVTIFYLMSAIAIIVMSGLNMGFSPTHSLIGLAGLLAIPTSYLLFLWQGRQPLTWLQSRITSQYTQIMRLNKFIQITASAERQLSQFCQTHPGTVFLALVFSLMIWVVIIFEYWLALLFLGLPLEISKIIILLAAARIAYFTPLPAGLGALEASQVIVMSTLGLPPAMGISLSLLVRTRDTALAGFGLWLVTYFTQTKIKKQVASLIGE